MSFEAFLIVSAVLFCIGLYGALARRNVLAVLMSIELMFNAVNVTLVAMAKYLAPAALQDDISSVLTGQVFAVFIITVAVDPRWDFLPIVLQERVELVQSRAVSTLSGEVLGVSGVTSQEDQAQVQSSGLADLLIGDYVLPFEAVSVLLLAALIGALALVRPDPGTGRG